VFGMGDVQFMGHQTGLSIRLVNPKNRADRMYASVPLEGVHRFVNEVDALVPPNEASYDVDSWLQELSL
jgi:hypothetical protein